MSAFETYIKIVVVQGSAEITINQLHHYETEPKTKVANNSAAAVQLGLLKGLLLAFLYFRRRGK